MEKSPKVAVDGIILSDDKIVIIERDDGLGFALPGGGVKYGEKLEVALKREMKEETNLDVEVVRLIGAYSEPDRDPRWHCVAISYLCKVVGGKLRAGDDAKDAMWVDLKNAAKMSLAFDHKKVIADFLSSHSPPAEGNV